MRSDNAESDSKSAGRGDYAGQPDTLILIVYQAPEPLARAPTPSTTAIADPALQDGLALIVTRLGIDLCR
jgi:hypothetical protein